MPISAKVRAKRHSNLKKTWESALPIFDPSEYRVSVLKFVNAMTDVDYDARQKIAIEYWSSVGEDVRGFDKVAPYYFYSAATIAYLKSKEIKIIDYHEEMLLDKYLDIKSRVPKTVIVAPIKPIVPKENNSEVAKLLGAEIDNAIDVFMTAGTKLNIKSYLSQVEASAQVCKEIASYYIDILKELKEAKAGKDEQLVEGYSHLPRKMLTNFIDYVESIITEATQMSELVRIVRKPRVHKEKPPMVVARKVVFMSEYDPLKLKSVRPETVVGATQVWMFNTKYRKLFRYEALDGMTLTWQGTVLRNWDPLKSGGKTIRKPEALFPEITETTRKRLDRLFSEIKGVLAKATGRVNNEVVIVRVF